MEHIMDKEYQPAIEKYIAKLEKSGDISIIHDYLNMWTKSVDDLLNNLRDTIPGPGMIGEVHYWRDLARVLIAITEEVKQPQVEFTIQLLLKKNEMDALRNSKQDKLSHEDYQKGPLFEDV